MDSRVKTYIFLGIFAVIVLAGVAALAFYGDEVRVLAAGGWNKGAMKATVTGFIENVQKGDYDAAMEKVADTRFEPVREGGTLVGMKKIDPSGLSPATYRFKKLFPEGQPTVAKTEYSKADGGAWLVLVTFPSGKEAAFLLGQQGSGFQIIEFLGAEV